MTGRRGLLWPLLLVTIGTVFLAGNLGLIPAVRLDDVLALWPLVLIVLGIDIALARRAPLLAVAAELAVLALGVALVVAQPAYPGWSDGGALSGGTSPRGTASVSAPRGGEQSLRFRLSGGAGSFSVHGGARDLVNVTSDRDDLVLTESRAGASTTVRVEQRDRGPRFGGAGSAHVDAAMASDVPSSLEVNAGAGEFVLDLRDVRLSDARVNVGAASLRLVLPRPSGDVPITVSAGASSVVIEVPDGVEAQVGTTGALVSTRSENPRISGAETSGYGSARDRVTVRVSAGASSIVIR